MKKIKLFVLVSLLLGFSFLFSGCQFLSYFTIDGTYKFSHFYFENDNGEITEIPIGTELIPDFYYLTEDSIVVEIDGDKLILSGTLMSDDPSFTTETYFEKDPTIKNGYTDGENFDFVCDCKTLEFQAPFMGGGPVFAVLKK